MRRTTWKLAACLLLALGFRSAADETQRPDAAKDYVTRTYPVADVLTYVPAPQLKLGQPTKPGAPRLQPLIEHLRRTTGADNWKEDQASVRTFETTLSFVIRQTPEMHARIIEELRRLRREHSVLATVGIVLVKGPRHEIQELTAAFPGELGKFEQEQLLERAAESKTLTTMFVPKMTSGNRMALTAATEQTCVVVHPTISNDRRSIRLKVAATAKDDPTDLVSSVEIVTLHDGRAAAIHFESSPLVVGAQPPDDAEELLVIVSPTIKSVEEEEELLGVPTVSAEK